MKFMKLGMHKLKATFAYFISCDIKKTIYSWLLSIQISKYIINFPQETKIFFMQLEVSPIQSIKNF